MVKQRLAKSRELRDLLSFQNAENDPARLSSNRDSFQSFLESFVSEFLPLDNQHTDQFSANLEILNLNRTVVFSAYQASHPERISDDKWNQVLRIGSTFIEGAEKNNTLTLLLRIDNMRGHSLGVMRTEVSTLRMAQILENHLKHWTQFGLSRLSIRGVRSEVFRAEREIGITDALRLENKLDFTGLSEQLGWSLVSFYANDGIFLELYQLRNAVALISLIAAGMAIWVGFTFSRRLTMDLQMLIFATEKVADGDLSERLLHSKFPELTRLGDAFNRMLAELASSKDTLSRQGELLKATGEMAKIGGWELDLESKTLLWSEEVARIHELETQSPPSPKEMLQFYPGKAKDFIAKSMTSLVRNNEAFDIEIPFMSAKGTYRWVRSKARPVVEKGRVVKILGTFQDITDLKNSELKIREAKSNADKLAAQALEASLAKSQFLANMSHELRTPMNGVIGMAEVLLESPLNQDQRSLIDALKESAFTLVDLLNDILDSSKIEAGKLSISAIEFNPEQHFSRLDTLFQAYASKKGVELSYFISSEIPKSLEGDPERISQIVTNFLSNAIKFTDEGGKVGLNIEISREDEHECELVFSVSDTGIGVSKKNQQLIFEAFSQEDSSTTRLYGGTGLGLSISRELASLLGGRLEIESEKNVGSTFKFFCPLKRIVSSDKPDAIAVHETVLFPEKKLKILVAEDNLVNQKVVTRLLENRGHEVAVACNGKEAVETAAELEFDVILMDLQMPVMNGEEAVRIIREKENGRKTPIIALTAYASLEDRARCLENGMDEYVTKPVRKSELFEAIAKVIRSNVTQEDVSSRSEPHPSS